MSWQSAIERPPDARVLRFVLLWQGAGLHAIRLPRVVPQVTDQSSAAS